MKGNSDPIELMQRAKQGDKEAFAALFSLYLTPVYRYIFIRVRDTALAEDITQTVFLKVYEALPRYENVGKAPLAYFLTVARNTLTDYFRKKKDLTGSQGDDALNSVPDDAPSPLAFSEAREARGELYEALDALPSDQRQALTLRYLNSLSNKEIGQCMEKSEENVRQLQSRGLRALRKLLGYH